MLVIYYNVSSKCDHVDENLHIGVLDAKNNKSLKIKDRCVENRGKEIKTLRGGYLQLL